MAKIFSVPLNPKLTPDQYVDFVNFINEHKDLIYDVYFTARIPPFTQDAMGDIFQSQDDHNYLIDAALNIQRATGIPISATFNNTSISPTQQNLDTWIFNFKPLYDAGVRIVTIPHTHWMATGQIKAAFPDLLVKNTILRDVRTATEIVNLAKYGFDYINLDRDLMRDRDTLLRLKKAKEWVKENLGKDIKFSLLANEGCLGNCPMMVEHFEFNNTRAGQQPQYFNDPISRVSCPKWDTLDPSVHLKTANLPPWKADWEEFINELGIDVFKMHGRESHVRLMETIDIISRWANNEEILFDQFNKYINDNNLKDKPIDIWRDKIKNCKFDCWECQYCDKIYKAKSPFDHTDLVKHVVESISLSGIPTVRIDVPGLTSPRVHTLLNTIAQGVDTYMEIGSYLGSTLCSVLKDNYLTAFAIDKWKQNIQPQNGQIMPMNSIEVFVENLKKYKGDSIVNIIDCDLFEVDISSLIGSIKMWFYDGPHDKESTRRAVEHYYPCFADEAILIFDDANWQGVVEGAREGLNNVGAYVVYEKLILNSEENPREWWNGLYILVIKKDVA